MKDDCIVLIFAIYLSGLRFQVLKSLFTKSVDYISETSEFVKIQVR